MRREKTPKFLISLLGVLLLSAIIPFTGYAAVPQAINHQGYLTDSAGNPVDATVQMTFKIYDVASNGTELWAETHSSVQVNNGVYSVSLGSVDPTGNPLNLPFDTQYSLGVEVGADGEMIPRQMLTSMPYAFSADYAANADMVDNKNASDLLDKATYDADNDTKVDSAEISDTVNAPLDLSGSGPEPVIKGWNTGSGAGGHFKSESGYGLIVEKGRVGIGTTEPSAALDVKLDNTNVKIAQSAYDISNGAISFRDGYPNYYDHAIWLIDSGANGGMIGGITNKPAYDQAADYGLYFVPPYRNNWDDWEAKMSIKSSGKVGIGTANPNEKLEIASGRMIVSDGGGADRQVILLDPPSISRGYGRILSHKYGENSGGRDLVLQDSGGNVGIGTMIPSDKLTVEGEVDAPNFVINATNSGTGAAIKGTHSVSGSYGVLGSWGVGVVGVNSDGSQGRLGHQGIGIYGLSKGMGCATHPSTDNYAGYFCGDVGVTGNLSFGTGLRDFRISEVLPTSNIPPRLWSDYISYGGIAIGSLNGGNRQMAMFTDGAESDNIFTIAASADNGANWDIGFAVMQNGNVSMGNPDTSTYVDLRFGRNTMAGINIVETETAGDPGITKWIFPFFRGLQTDNLIIREEVNNIDVMTFEFATGNVGVGVSNPAERLDVNGGINLGTTANSNAGTIRWSGTDFEGYTGTAWASLTSGGGSGGGLWTDAGAYIYPNSASQVAITDSGKVGIGTTDPSDSLTVNGALRLVPRPSSTCNSGNAGAMYYDSNDKEVYVCTDESWVKLAIPRVYPTANCVNASPGRPGICNCSIKEISKVTAPAYSTCVAVVRETDHCTGYSDGLSTAQCCVCAD